MTTQDLINTLKQGRPMTDKLMRVIVRELEEKNEQLHTMATALRAKDADYAALKAAAGFVITQSKWITDHAKDYRKNPDALIEAHERHGKELARLCREG
jgi:hypothetical protein